MIPYGRQDITQRDIEAVVEVLKSDFLTQGSVVPQFESLITNYCSVNYAVAVNSATGALHLACLALGLAEGDWLWTSPISFVASANCGVYCGAKVDFVDIDPDTALMCVSKLEKKLIQAEKNGTLPKVVIPVHFAGQSCDVEDIFILSKKYGFRIIEDASHAIGGKYKDKRVGNCLYSDITIFSFHPVKIITTGEGGVATTNDQYLAEKMKLLRSHGITRNKSKMINNIDGPWYYEQIELGYNYRLTDIQAALGCSQMNRLDEYVNKRSKISLWYDESFKKIGVEPLFQKTDRLSAHHLYVIRIVNMEQRDCIYDELIKSGIGVNLHYIPIYRQPYYVKNFEFNSYPSSDKYYKSAISLPLFPTITDQMLNKVVSSVVEAIKKC